MQPPPDPVTGLFLSDFSDLAGLADCSQGGRRIIEVTGTDALVLLARSIVPEALPSRVRLQRASMFAPAKGGRHEPAGHGWTTRWIGGPTHDRNARAAFGPDEAGAAAVEFLALHQPHLVPLLAPPRVNSHVSRTLYPDGSTLVWTNGFLVVFDALHEGVRVWTDQVQVTLVGDEIRQVLYAVHLPDPTVAAQSPVRLAPALTAQAAAAQRMAQTHPEAVLTRATLAYAPAALVGLKGEPEGTYSLAWLFEYSRIEASRRSPPWTVWIDAATGEPFAEVEQ